MSVSKNLLKSVIYTTVFFVLAFGILEGVHAQQPQARQITMEAQPLEEALVEVGQRYGIVIVVPEGIAADRTAPPVSGVLTADEVIAQLLKGSGLEARRSDDGAIVIAQSSSQDQSGNLHAEDRDEIVVRGERAARSLSDTLASVSVLVERDIEERAQQDVYESLIGLPNTVFADGNSLPAIRGQTNNSGPGGRSLGNSALNGVEPRTVLVIDDFARSPSWANSAYTTLFDIEQIEVYRGPQSTLRGRNAISGAFVMQTKDPTFDFEAGALAEGTYNELDLFGYRFGGVVSGPLVADELAARLVVQHQLDNDAIDGFLPGRYGGTGNPDDARKLETTSVRGKLLWTPSAVPGLRTELSGTYVNFSGNLFQNLVAGPGTDPTVSFEDRLNFGFDYRVVDGKSFFGGMDTTYDINDNHSFQLLVSYGDDFFETDEDLNSSVVFFEDATDTILAVEGLWRFGNGGETIEGFLAGAYLRRVTDWDTEVFGTTPLLIDNETDTYSVYSDIRITPVERLEVNLGGRVLFTEQLRNFTFGAPAIIDEKVDDTAILPQFGALYDLTDNQTIGASIRRGYGDGGRGFSNLLFSPYDFDPETVWTLEGIYRYAGFDGALNVNVAVFHNWYRDQQFSVSVDTGGSVPDTIISNQPKSKSYGAEFEIALSPTERLDLRTTIGLLSTEVTEVASNVLNISAGNEFGFDPSVTFNFSGNWQVTDIVGLYGDISYVGEYFNDVTNANGEAGDYVLANVGATVDVEPVRLRFFVQNISDELARTFQFLDSSATVTQPRTFGISASANF